MEITAKSNSLRLRELFDEASDSISRIHQKDTAAFLVAVQTGVGLRPLTYYLQGGSNVENRQELAIEAIFAICAENELHGICSLVKKWAADNLMYCV